MNKQAGPVAGMTVQRCRCKLFLTTVKKTNFLGKQYKSFSYKQKRHLPAYLASQPGFNINSPLLASSVIQGQGRTH
jgi:hypothetical protein